MDNNSQTRYHQDSKTIGKPKLQDEQSWDLARQWVLWHMDENDDGWNSLDERVKQVVQVDSIHQFWAMYAYVRRPQHLPANSEYFFFRKGFPDENNASELCRIIYNRSFSLGQDSKISDCWQRAMMGVAGEQFGKFSSDIYGVSITSICGFKFQLMIWLRNSSDAAEFVKCRFRELLGLSIHAVLGLETKSDGAELDSSVNTSDMSRERQVEKKPIKDSVFWSHQCVREPPLKTKEQTNDVKPSSSVLKFFGGAQAERLSFADAYFSPVLVIKGYDPRKINCQMIYNLCCSYGPCVKVAFSRAHDYSTCFVEMVCFSNANCVCRNLDGCELNGKRLSVKRSFHKAAVYAPDSIFKMPDGTPSFIDFTNANRENAAGLWVPRKALPSTHLCFYNASPNSTAPMISKLFDFFSIQPSDVVIRPMVRDTCAGSIVFKTQDDALEALMLVNNYRIMDPFLQREYIFKLCFGDLS